MKSHNSTNRGLSVLNVIITIPDARVGGAERAGLKFGDSLSNQVSVDTVMMSGEKDEHLFEEMGLLGSVHPIPSYTIVRDLLEQLVSSDNNIWNPTIATRLTPPKPLDSYDLVHIHNPVPIFGMLSVAVHCKIKNIPYFVTTHGISKIPVIPDELGLNGMQTRLFEHAFVRIYKFVLRHARHLFVLSQSDRQTVKEWFPQQSSTVIPNGVDISTEVDSSDVHVDIIDSSKPTLLFVGRIMASKGIDDLLEAFKFLETPCQLILVGPMRDAKYETMIENSSSDVQYLGYVSQSDLNYLYKKVDIFVFPTRSDVFPLVTLEAMSAGTPVVTTKVGGLPEQIPDGAGILTPPRRPDLFAESIEELIQDRQMLEEMGQNAMRYVSQNYSWDAVTSLVYQKYVEQIQL